MQLPRTRLSFTWRASARCALINDRVVEFLTCLRMKTTIMLLLKILVRDFGEKLLHYLNEFNVLNFKIEKNLGACIYWYFG